MCFHSTDEQSDMARTKLNQSEAKYPKGEDVCVVCCKRGGEPLFLVTTKPLTGYFFLYEFTGDGLKKLGKGLSPLELEEKFDVKRRMYAE